MSLLCQTQGLQDEIRGNEKNIKVFVDEVLRMEAPVQGLPRVVTRDTNLGGYELKAGDVVMVRYGAANRDERQFENPDKVDVRRKKAGMQMAFGSGVHHCIGAPLARQELSIGFYELMDKFQNFSNDEDKPAPAPDPSLILRGLPHLHIRYEERGA
jgi:cytochrome P450